MNAAKKILLVCVVLVLLVGTAYAAWKTAYSKLTTMADVDSIIVLDVSDTSMAASGTQKYMEFSDLYAQLTTAYDLVYQPLDADLTTFAGITPSANVQTLLGSADYAAFKTSLSLDSVENTALSTWAGTTNLDVGATAFADLNAGDTYSNFSTSADDDTLNELFAAIDTAIGLAGSASIGDEAFTSGNFDGDTSTGVSQDDFYDRFHLFDADDDGDFTDEAWFPSASGAPTDAYYYVSQADAGLSNEIVIPAFVQSILDDTDEATFKATVNLEVGTDVQAYDADLTTYAGITPSANVQSLLGAADYAAMKVLLDLEIGTDVQAYSATLADMADGSFSADVSIAEVSADPDDPSEGYGKFFISDGTGTGDDGDLFFINTAGGLTQTIQLTYHSAGTLAGGGGAETNSLETTITGIADTEIFVGDGNDSGAFVTISGDASLANTGALTIANDAVTMAKLDDDGNFTDWTGNWTFATGTVTLSNGATLGGAILGAGQDIGTAASEIDDIFLNDGGVIQMGDDQDVTITHVADTGVLINSAMQIQFRDSAIHIESADDGHLDLTADTSIDLNGTVAFGGDLAVAAAQDVDLVDNNASALSFDAAGQAGILTIITTDGSEGISSAGSITGATVTDGTVTLAGDGTITGVSVGGLPDNIVDNGMMADDAVGVDELATDSVTMDAVDADGNFTSLTGNWYTTGQLNGRLDVDAHTSTGSINTQACYGGVVTNTGASGAIVLTLPDAVEGMSVLVCLTAAYDVDINPNGTERILVETDADGDALSSDATVGSTLSLVAVSSTQWLVIGSNGTWTDAD